jgi:hypothetical protein
MRLAICACLAASAFATSTCHADGFFRRVPQVGEWALYDVVMEYSANDKLGDESPKPDDLSVTGSLALKCVGEEAIDGTPHLWIEIRFEMAEPGGSEHWMIVKALIPSDQLTEENVAEHIVRGWSERDDEDVYEIDLSAANFDDDASYFGRMLAFPEYDQSVGRRESRTLVVNGEEVQVAHSESGPLREQPIADEGQISGEATWWPSEPHAFGVAAAELRWIFQESGQFASQMEVTIRMDLVETGIDAVSDLPDHN